MTEVSLSPARQIAAVMEAKKASLQAIIPPNKFDTFMANVMSQLKPVNAQGKPNALLRCTPDSFYAAAHQAAVLGLQPGLLGEVYLVPYGNTAALIVGYKGMLKLARQHRDVVKITAACVYKDETYERDGATGEVIHKTSMDIDKSDDNLIGAYCRVVLRDCEEPLTFDLNKKEIDKRRARSAGANGPFWRDNYAAMCRKTVIRAFFNGGELPISDKMEEALAHEARQEKQAEVLEIRTERPDPIVSEVHNAMDPILEDSDSPSGSDFAEEMVRSDAIDDVETMRRLEEEGHANVRLAPDDFITPEELEAPVKTRAPNKKKTLEEIGGMGLGDATITSTASDMFAETVLDINVLSAAQLVRLKEQLEKLI